MKKLSSVEAILNKYGWRTVSGRVEYKGFEHLLNRDMPNLQLEPELDPEPEITPQVIVEAIDPKTIASRATHSQLIAAQKRVDDLKLRMKERTGGRASNGPNTNNKPS